jgi:hypothetical protein
MVGNVIKLREPPILGIWLPNFWGNLGVVIVNCYEYGKKINIPQGQSAAKTLSLFAI